MRVISHRGNLFGPDLENENHPDQVLKVLKMGFDCEIDVWREDGEFYLGHNEPKYLIDGKFLHSPQLWVHAKNLNALNNIPFSKRRDGSLSANYVRFFWHQTDDFTLTSDGLIWTFPNKEVCGKSIIVDNDKNWREKNYSCYGVCTDWVL